MLRGNPQHRPISEDEPRPKPIAPRCPSWLSPAAKRHWRDLASELEAIGVLTTIDVGAFASLCESTALDVGQIFQAARRQHRTPESVLTDNGCIFTAEHRGGKVVLETELERLGVQHKRSRPYHPQTCGKVERFHQTLKRYLTKQPAAPSLRALQAQLDRFVRYCNEERPHRALGRQTPREVFDAKLKARPSAKVATHFRIRHDKVDRYGTVTLRYDSKLFHIGLGARHKGLPVVLLVPDRDVRVVSAEEGELLRHFTLDPSRDYQRQSA